MEHNSLTGIACARPIIYAEGLFAPCTLEDGKFVPEEGLSQQDLWSVLNGEFFKSGSDLVEDFALKTKLEKLPRDEDDTCYEMEYFPRGVKTPSPSPPQIKSPSAKAKSIKKNITASTSSIISNAVVDISTAAAASVLTKSPNMKDRGASRHMDGIPLVRLRQNSTSNSKNQSGATNITDIFGTPSCVGGHELRDFFEKQITWLLEEEEGEDFVVMETCNRFNDAMVLLEILKQHNIPCVVSFLARRDEPVAISFSKIQIGLDCLMFCLFQA